MYKGGEKVGHKAATIGSPGWFRESSWLRGHALAETDIRL